MQKSKGMEALKKQNRTFFYNATGVNAINKEEVNWTTLYIAGKADFRSLVRKKLDHSRVNFMTGYTGNSSCGREDMYWIEESTDLRQVKEAIGAKFIWKYRLHFYTSLEEFIESRNKKTTGFSDDENDLIKSMQGVL